MAAGRWRFGLVAALSIVSPLACGDDDGGGGGGAPDASSDAAGGNAGASAGGTGNAGGSAGTGGGSGSGGSAGGADADVPIDAKDASYTLELGAQVDALLESQHPASAGVEYVLTTPPTLGLLLHFDTASGRFVYTSLELGSDSFEFAISKAGQTVDSAKITITTSELDFNGDWHLDPAPAGCPDYTFTVSPSDGSTYAISPLMSDCLEDDAGITLYSGSSTQTNVGAQSLGIVSCVNDISNVNYCYAFRFERASSRGDYRSIETVSGNATIGGVPHLISGAVGGRVRREGDVAQRGTLVSKSGNVIQLGPADGTPEEHTLTLENNGALAVTIGELTLPPEVTLESGGTCGASLDPGQSCTLKLTIVPTPPASGNQASAPLSIRYADSAGFDIARLSVNWLWQTP